MAEYSINKIINGENSYTFIDDAARDLANPTGGTTGQVLTKTATGTEWADAQGGGAAPLGSAENPFVIGILNSVYGPLKTSAKDVGVTGVSTADLTIENGTKEDILEYMQSGHMPHVVIMAKSTAESMSGVFYTPHKYSNTANTFTASYTEVSAGMPTGGTTSQVRTSVYNVSVSIGANIFSMKVVAGLESTRNV